MKNCFLSILVLAISLLSFPVFSQTETKTEKDTTLIGLPGDNLDLYAVLDLFQKSKTIEEFEKNLNLEKTGINNLDLDLDNKVDFIKVETKKNGDDYTFILQVDVSKTEKQDVAVILLSKDKDEKITMQIVGDKDLYGKDYIVELKESKTPSSTPNPGYIGNNPDTVVVPASTTTVVVQSAPIVVYVYSPAYVPYYPPYHYGYYPPYFAAFTVMAVGVYRHNNYYYHGYGGYGYHGNTTVIHNTNNYYNYNNSRNSSNTVRNNNNNGNYNRGNNASTRPANGAGGSGRPSTGTGATRPSTQPSTRPSTGGGSSGAARPSTKPSTGGGGGRPSASTQPSNRSQNMSSGSSRPTTQPSNRSSGGGSRYNSGGGSGGSRGGGGRGGGGRR